MRFYVYPRSTRVLADASIEARAERTIQERTIAIDPTPQVAATRAALLNLAATAPWRHVEAMLAACKAVE